MSNFTKAGPRTSDVTLESYRTYMVGGVEQRQYFAPVLVRKVTYSRSSVNTPNYKILRRSSQLPVNNFSAGYTIETVKPGTVKVNVSSPYSHNGSLSYWYNSDITDCLNKAKQPSVSKVQEMAVSRVLASVKGMSFNAAQAFAERGQTTRLLVKSVARAADFVIAVKKGNILQAHRLLRESGIPVKKLPGGADRKHQKGWKEHGKSVRDDSSSLWLELQYGWKPLAQDIYGSAELLAKQYHENRAMEAVGSAKLQDSGSNPVYRPRAGVIASYEWSSVVKSKVGLHFVMSNDIANLLSRTGISNPALLAWELLPFSFVADWFLPVGQYLNNIDATLGLQFSGGFVNLFTETKKIGLIVGVDGAVVTPGGNLVEASGFSRVRLTSFPGQSLPSFKNPISVTHAANAIALVTQLLKGR